MSTPPDQTPPPPVPPSASEPPSSIPPSVPEPPSDEVPEHSMDERNMAMLTHLSGLLLNFIVPLIVWLMYKDQGGKKYLVAEAKVALNFQITVLIGYVICWILTFVVIGAVLFWLLWLVNLIFCIWAAIKVSNTGSFRYPYSLQLIN